MSAACALATGYDAMFLGESDFHKTKMNLLEFINHIGSIPVVSSNVDVSLDPEFSRPRNSSSSVSGTSSSNSTNGIPPPPPFVAPSSSATSSNATTNSSSTSSSTSSQPQPTVVPYLIVERGGTKIGIASALSKDYVATSNIPATIQVSKNLTTENSVRRAVSELRERGCGIIVFGADAAYESVVSLAMEVEHIDIVLAGLGVAKPMVRDQPRKQSKLKKKQQHKTKEDMLRTLALWGKSSH